MLLILLYAYTFAQFNSHILKIHIDRHVRSSVFLVCFFACDFFVARFSAILLWGLSACFCNRLCWFVCGSAVTDFFGCCLVLFACLFAGLMKKLWTDVNNSFIRGNLAMINKVKVDISATKQLSRDTQFITAEVGKWETERGLRWLTVRQRQTLYLLSAHLVPYGFLGWEVEGVHLRKLWSQMIVELPEFGVTPVHIPLIVQDADIHLKTCRHITMVVISINTKIS